ncbi:flavin monoamine oxidase family protein [Nannocystis pusilla]|uniref:flavin monoamine oxidase family protein n=1 Tax=Nannocystis pusilla TaxID=889268 RepID=UPI003DA54212
MSRSIYSRLHRRFGPRPTGVHLRETVRARIEALKARFPVESMHRRPGRPRERLGRSAVVVGAGLGGITAGYMLANWFDVTVLEASDRVGGRTYSRADFTSGRTIEFGGELIGWNHPLWLHLAEELELGLSMITDEASFEAMGLATPTRIGGRDLGADEAEHMYEEMSAALAVMNADAATLTDPYAPWLAPRAAEWDARPLADFIAAARVSDLAKAGLVAQFSNNNGVAPAAQSYLANLANVAGAAMWDHRNMNSFWDDLEVARCSQGNQALSEALRARIDATEHCRVRTGAPVRAIEIGDAGVAVTVDGGERLTADFVVLAAPPTVWSKIQVTPAISLAPQMGTIVKYLSDVDRRLWLRAGKNPMALDDQVGMLWEGSDNQIGGPGLELTLFAGGAAARAAIAAPDPRAYFDAAIERIYPGYTQQRTRTEFMDWEAQPWTRGGYSCPAPKQVTTVMRALNEAHHGRLFFAGEHASAPFFGFMEGALQSGLLAALRVLERAGVHPSPRVAA